MQGLRSSLEDETDKITRDRRTEDSGSLASGELLAPLVGAAICCSNVVVDVAGDAGRDERALLVSLTNRGRWQVVGPLMRGTRNGRQRMFIPDKGSFTEIGSSMDHR